MMRTFCVFVLNFFSLLYVRLYNKNVTSLPRFLPFYVRFTVILWNIFPLLTLFCVCLFVFSFSFAPNAQYFFSERLHHHIIVEKNLQSIAWFCWRSLNRIHSRWKFLQTEKPQPKWERWDDDFSCAFFYIAQLISIGWFKSSVSFFTFFGSCFFFFPMFGVGTLFHFTPCWWNGYRYHQPSVLLFFDICILLIVLPLTFFLSSSRIN